MLTAAVRGWAGSSNAALDVDHFAFGSARGTTEAIVSLVDAVRNPSRDSSPGDHTTTSAPPLSRGCSRLLFRNMCHWGRKNGRDHD